jgi:hypothetical protein
MDSGPRPFEVMFLTHTAIQIGVDAAVDAIERRSIVAKWKWKGLSDTIENHAKQEDKVLYPLANEMADDVCATEDFLGEHHEEEKLRMRITEDLSKGRIDDEVFARVRAWRDVFLAHVKHEEEHLIPLLRESAISVEERGAVVRKIIAYDRAWFMRKEVPFVLKQLLHLEKRSGAETPLNFENVVVYSEAIQYSTSPDEYLFYLSVLKDTIGEDHFEMLVAMKHSLMEDGKQSR